MHRMHRAGELITAARHGHDVAVLTLFLVKRPAQLRDALTEAGLIDESVGPDILQKSWRVMTFPGF